jgi:hypothetical protein
MDGRWEAVIGNLGLIVLKVSKVNLESDNGGNLTAPVLSFFR